MSGWFLIAWFSSPWLNPNEWGDPQVAMGTVLLAVATFLLSLQAWSARRDQAKLLALQRDQMSSLQAPYVHPRRVPGGAPGFAPQPPETWDFADSYSIGARNDGKGVAWHIEGVVEFPSEADDWRRSYGPFTLGVGNEVHLRAIGEPLRTYDYVDGAYGHFVYRDSLHDRWVTRFLFEGFGRPLQCVVWSYERVDGEGDVPLEPPPGLPRAGP